MKNPQQTAADTRICRRPKSQLRPQSSHPL